MSEETDLPPELALLWGRRELPRRGPKAALTIQDITRAAIAVADAEGLDAVSMARVAAQLGNSTMALYRYVKSKNELLVLMSDLALAPPPDYPAGGGWRDNLVLWSKELVGNVRRHPWHAKIPVSGPPFGPNSLLWLDRALSAFDDVELSEVEKFGLVMSLMTYVRGGYLLSMQLAEGYAENPEGYGRNFGNALRVLVDPRRYPALSKTVATGIFDVESLWDEEEDNVDFEFGLNVFLDGIAAYIERRNLSS